LKLNYDKLLSNFAFKNNLRHSTEEAEAAAVAEEEAVARGGKNKKKQKGAGGRAIAAVDVRENDLRSSLKRKYGASIMNLKDEFLRKRKKGKLPQPATTALKVERCMFTLSNPR
jgi:hypothetical protein